MERQSFDNGNGKAAMSAGQRNATRDSLLLTARLKPEGRPEEQVRIRNLSAGGLMAEYPAMAPVGTPVQVEIRGIGWIKGSVAWATDGRLGIAFDNKVDPLSARKPVGGQARAGTKPKPKPLIPFG
ncbi:PilZ domain-containing protein [Sphingomonas sp. BGYR3]|uniref:PilZ domain-containing protein n=1 Tax=Sphingomonas sp. BGYR3 TaxID=2975483 RepID=UPI0021A7746F|nr:PilZ domain-containing protein [Sphingomonas sp. BGYR3]MDG5487130.1 PilZ domain-containing protein [Sphingomonas sp. BGYR3]